MKKLILKLRDRLARALFRCAYRGRDPHKMYRRYWDRGSDIYEGGFDYTKKR